MFSEITEQEKLKVLNDDITVHSFAKILSNSPPNSVVVMVGAGISVSAGIPDFRTPGTGLYDNLQKYNLPSPESVFDIGYFSQNPKAFFSLAKEMWPENFTPTPTHYFIKLLQEKGLLRRCFTQNIDTLERIAGIDPELLVEAHGSFGEATCIKCHQKQTKEWIKKMLFEKNQNPVICPSCEKGFVKPDIVFFGEELPERFSVKIKEDLPNASLLIVMGTSLKVYPFAGIVNMVPPTCPRLLINMNLVGLRLPQSPSGFRFEESDNYRDVALVGTCDDGVKILSELCGWKKELESLIGKPFSETTKTIKIEDANKIWRTKPKAIGFGKVISVYDNSVTASCELILPNLSTNKIYSNQEIKFQINLSDDKVDLYLLCIEFENKKTFISIPSKTESQVLTYKIPHFQSKGGEVEDDGGKVLLIKLFDDDRDPLGLLASFLVYPQNDDNSVISKLENLSINEKK
eukprot:c21932_g1_i2.p1 GENE.c21932_g1_i2~~c21932_g1_i2.p1  ORF type:complete len:461 (+),score=215.73 c21932_g1_i2:107-1489(+)